MHLVIIFGPPAVGKMTVGRAFSDITGFSLFHNHVTIEAVRSVFPFDHPRFWPLVGEFRRRIFEEAAAGDLPGLIFTYVWSLDDPGDKAYIDGVCSTLGVPEATTCFVELETTLETRLQRNEHEARLLAKPSKRDVVLSRRHLLNVDTRARMNSAGDFFYPERHLKISNTALPPMESPKRLQLSSASSVGRKRVPTKKAQAVRLGFCPLIWRSWTSE